jgi:hypothetical protein
MTQGEATLCQFALQALDPVMDYPVLEARFEIEDLSGLRVILADDAEGDHDLRCGYTLDIDQLAAIRSLCDVAFDPGDRPVVLAPWHSIREAPYLVHTGSNCRSCSTAASHYQDLLMPTDEVMARFQPFVNEGRIMCRVVDEAWPTPRRLGNRRVVAGHREVYFTLPGEEWRVDAYRLLYEVGSKTRWNDTLERREGRLLGYEEWQND